MLKTHPRGPERNNISMRYLILLGSIWCSLLVAADRLPNIVILLADDLGYGELGCQGNQQIPTPHIDSIAKNGVRFTQGYVTAVTYPWVKRTPFFAMESMWGVGIC